LGVFSVSMEPCLGGVQLSASEVATNVTEREPAPRKRPRSAITSGRRAFIEGNPNSAWARRYYDLVAGHVADLGGRPALSEAQFSLVRRAASIECELERLDAALSAGQAVDLDSYGRATSHLRRLFETLGLRRVAHDVSNTLHEQLEWFDGDTAA
jgi:hypothetical protein